MKIKKQKNSSYQKQKPKCDLNNKPISVYEYVIWLVAGLLSWLRAGLSHRKSGDHFLGVNSIQ